MKKLLTLLLSALLIVGTLPVLAGYAAQQGGGENIALGKTVTPTSTLAGFNIAAVNDGNINTIWARGNLGMNEGFVVDLGEPYRLTSVVLHPRLDQTDPNYRKRVALEFSNTPDFAVKERIMAMTDDDLGFGVPVEVPITTKTAYRYVRAVKTDIFIFVLAEIEIYGYIPDPNALEIGADVSGYKHEGPISLLAYLGLVENVNEEIFGVDHLLTRAQAAQAVVKAFGGNASFSGYLPFSDIPTTHKHYNDIMSAYHLGIVTGDDNTTFRPDEYVTKTELLFMTLRAIGYDDVVQKIFGNNVGRMLGQAEELDLLEGVDYEDYDEPISRGDAARVFYNALLAPDFNMYAAQEGRLVFEDEADLLRRRHSIVLTQGVVEENRISTLDGDAKQAKNAASISGRAFSDPNGALDAYLGRNVIVATSLDESGRILLAWLTGRDEELVIPASRLISKAADIEAGRIIALDENGEDEKYSLEDSYRVMKNGVAHPYYTAADLMLSNGQLRLLDNNRNGVYDVVFIEEYTLHYVTGAFSDDTELTIVDTNGERKLVQREALSITNAAGSVQSVSKITKDTVIKLFATPDGKNCRIILYSTPITGQLTAISEEDATIGSTAYPLSLFYRNTTWSPAPQPGDAVGVFVDEAGEILWIERNLESIQGEWTIAFSQKTAIGTGLAPSVAFRLFTEKGVWQESNVADKVMVDGSSVTREELAEMIAAASGTERFELAMLRFKLSDAGEIKALDTLVETTAESVEGISFAKGQYIASGLFTPESSAFWNQHQQLALAKNTTPTFVIPTVSNAYTTDSSYNELYYVTTVVSAAGNRSSQTQKLQAYMPDEEGYPACFVKMGQNFEAGAGGSTGLLNAVTEQYAPILLVEKVSTAVADDQVVTKVSGYDIVNQKEASFYAETTLDIIETGLLYQEKPECIDSSANASYKNQVNVAALNGLTDAEKAIYISEVTDIGFGDLVRYQTVGTTVRAAERIFDYDQQALPTPGASPKGDTWYTVSGGYPDFYIGFYRHQFGSISNVGKNTFTLTTLGGYDETYQKSSVAKIIYCDTEGAAPSLVESKELYEHALASNRMMLYSYNGTPKVAIIYPY